MLQDFPVIGELFNSDCPTFTLSRAVLLLVKLMRWPSDGFWDFFSLPPSCIRSGDPVDIAMPIPVSIKLHSCGRGPMYVKSSGLWYKSRSAQRRSMELIVILGDSVSELPQIQTWDVLHASHRKHQAYSKFRSSRYEKSHDAVNR